MASGRLIIGTRQQHAQSQINLTFLGGGKIAQAMIQGLRQQQHDQSKLNFMIRAVDPNEKRLSELRSKGYQASHHLDEQFAHETDVLVLAVKPQQANDALKSLTKHQLRKSALLLSVVAGLPLKKIADAHPGTNSLVRAMPNTPATIGKGITVWINTPETTEEQLMTMRQILRAMGSEERVKDEDAVDIATAVSGSGPAYVLLLMESMIDSACHMGMPRDLARNLVEETFIGTAEYAKLSKSHTAVLREEITSPGGTTAAALYNAEKGRFRSVVSEMMWAAYRRARELGGKPPITGPM